MALTAPPLSVGFRPVIMGKGYLELKHFTGPNYTEVRALWPVGV